LGLFAQGESEVMRLISTIIAVAAAASVALPAMSRPGGGHGGVFPGGGETGGVFPGGGSTGGVYPGGHHAHMLGRTFPGGGHTHGIFPGHGATHGVFPGGTGVHRHRHHRWP
jgi:hypothetical protein